MFAEFPNLPTNANGHSSANDLDSEKQLKLHKYIINNSKVFFSVDMLANNKQKQCKGFETNSFTVMPPYEVFGFINKEAKLKHFLNELSEGEIIITSVASKTVSGLILKVLCTYTEPIRCVSDINVNGFCEELIPGLGIGDTLCCEVTEVIPEVCKLFCGIKGVKCHTDYRDLLGLFNMDNCPQIYKYFQSGETYVSYDSMLCNSTGFKNPSSICNLELITGLCDDRHSILPALSGSFPEKEAALKLRKVQSSQWAIQSVSEGIKHFKTGQHSQAFVCLNKALTIDSLNVEAYIARSALYASLGCFKKSFEDLSSALKISSKHVKGRKCFVESMISYAKTLELLNKSEKALQYYEDWLRVIPDHDEAKASIEYLRTKLFVGQKSSSSSSNISNCSSSSGSSSNGESTSFSDSDSEYLSSSKSFSDESSSNGSKKLKKERTSLTNTISAMIGSNCTIGGGSPYNSFISKENSKNSKCNEKVSDNLVGKIQKFLNQNGNNKEKKNFVLNFNNYYKVLVF